MLYELLKTYCKYKNIKLECNNYNVYIFYKRNIKILILKVSKTSVLINYKLSNIKKEIIYEDFLNYIKEEIKKEKLFKKFALTARPIKKLQYCKMKMTEYGRNYLRTKTENQSVHANENVAVTRWNRSRYRK